MDAFGVDEAGKGPVLGSMFAAAVVADPARLPPVADSKRLSAERRERVARELRADPAVTVGVAEIPVERIDDPGTDMNTLTVAAHAEALAAVEVEGRRGVLDAGDVDADRFARRVADPRDAHPEVGAEHRADERHPLVAAASVVAKVERDAHVEALAREYGAVGSGYPGDEQTRTFLREFVAEHGHLPACARSSWQTSQDALAAAEQSALDGF
jgi:ribonuclease HII